MLISTPYYRSLRPIHSLGCDDLAASVYSPYDLFCLETRLYSLVYQMFGRDVEIIFRSVHQNDRMEIKIDIIYIENIGTLEEPIKNPTIEMTEEQHNILSNKVKVIVSEDIGYCLIDKHELYLSSGRDYPINWFYTAGGYIELPTEYNPFLGPDGIYLTFNPDSNYKQAYNEVVKHILTTIDRYYQQGVVYGARSIAERWKLERLDQEEVVGKLYRPMWNDKRFGSHPVEFLLGKIQGDPYIKIKVSNNLVARHHIASILNTNSISMVYEGGYIKVPADNLDDAQYIAALVQSANTATGKVIVQSVTRLSWVYLYIEAANQLLGNPDCSGYQVSNIERPYIFSCIVDRNAPSETILEQLREMVLVKLSKGDNADHDSIEQRYIKDVTEMSN